MRRRQFFIAIAALFAIRLRFVSAPGGPGQPWKRERIYAGDWA